MRRTKAPGDAARAALWALLVVPASAQTELYRLDGTAGEQLGFSVAVVGDLDGDGADDFVVGAPWSDAGALRGGSVQLVSGRTGTVLQTEHGAQDDHFGYAVAGPGDLDGDGMPDWVVGAPQCWYEPGCLAGAFGGYNCKGPGYARAFSGLTGAPLYDVAPGGPFYSAHGIGLGTGGDVDGDGLNDFILCGLEARVIRGVDGQVIRVHDPYPQQVYSAAIVPNLNGMGKDDYVLGMFNSCGLIASGRVAAYRGPTGGQMWWTPGPSLSEYGLRVMSPGDLDGDQRPDVVASGLDDGRWIVNAQGFLQPLSGVDGSVLFSKKGVFWSGLGYALAPLGDLDQDGVPEYAVSSPGVEDLCGGQDLQVFSGTGTSSVLNLHYDSDCDRFGSALASGDVNGDGLTDLLVGARWDDDGGTDAGSLRVFSVFLGATVYCEAQVNSQGCTPVITTGGQPSVAASSFHVDAGEVLNQTAGLMFWGSAPKQTPFAGGYRCVQAPTKRTPAQSSGGNPKPPTDCSGGFSVPWSSAYIAAHGLSAGQSLYCQYWSRDPAAPSTTNLTAAVAFTLEP